jgi:NADH:ubiquinone oxidoreductase subunit E
MTNGQHLGGATAEAFDYAPVEELLQKYRGMKGALIPLLQGTQASYGFLPQEALMRISDNLGEPLASVFGVATFYAQFRLIPRGKNVVRVCHGTACHVSGAPLVSLEVERNLGIKDGENTEDMLFTLEAVACLGACGMAPVMMINDRTYGKLTPDKAVKAIVDFRATEGNGDGGAAEPKAESEAAVSEAKAVVDSGAESGEEA